MKVSFTKGGREFAIDDVEKLPAASVAYLLQYGFSQSLQDSIAGRVKAVREEVIEQERARLIEADPKADAVTIESLLAERVAELESDGTMHKTIESDINGALGKRLDAIMAGTVGTRVGVTRDPVESMRRRVAGEMLDAATKAKNVKRVTGDKRDELVDAILVKHADAVSAEAARRMDASKAIDIDL